MAKSAKGIPLSASILRLEQVSKTYPQRTQAAVEHVNLDIQAQEIVALLGPSGSGKTTLLRMIAGLECADQGRIWINEQMVDSPAHKVWVAAEKRDLGMVFQDYALWPHLSALENVALVLRHRKCKNWRSQAQEMLARVGLQEVAEQYPYQLSGGQQQRVALARALASQPQLLLFDEPLSNIDAVMREELRGLIARVVREAGLSAVYVTHDQSEAFFIADRVAILHRGNILQLATPETCYEKSATPEVARFTGAQGPYPIKLHDQEICWGEQLVLTQDHHWEAGTAQLFLRPDALRLSEEARPDCIPAIVQLCGYLGGIWCIEAKIGDEIVQFYHPMNLPVGASIHLNVDWTRALIYPDRK